MRIYFDVCCLNRPFDDQSQQRIRLEAEAINFLFQHIQRPPYPNKPTFNRAVAFPHRKPPAMATGAMEMIDVTTMTPVQIQQTGMEILVREMGAVGLIRFLQQFDMGYGDYTADRHKWLDDLSLDDLLNRLKQEAKQ